MFFKGVRKYGIRKLSVGVASIVVGLTTQLLMQPEVLADSVASSQMISFRYVIEDEVPSELKKSIQTHLTKTTVGDYQTYYLVYQEESKQSVLPKMNMQDASLILMTMGGVLIIGVTTVKGKRRKIITSIVLLTTLGSFPVQALTGVKLASYNRQIELQVGQELPDMALKIEGYRFLGYLLQDKLPFNHLLTEQNLRVIDEDIVFDTQYREEN